MSGVIVRPARSRADRRLFLTFPWRIYNGDPLWVPPLLPERRRELDPRRGAFFGRGEAELFIARSGREPRGTILAAVDREMNRARGARECLFGFFECRDDPEAAAALFDAASAWGRERGMDTLVGPFNLSYEDSYGVLIEGRDRPPAPLCGHTPPYYARLVESEGFAPLRPDNLAFALELRLDTAPFRALARLAERVRSRGRFSVGIAELGSWRRQIDGLPELLNRSLAALGDLRPWDRDTLEDMFRGLVRIADPELVLFAYDESKARKLVGWLPAVPNVNEALIHANGLRYPWSYLVLALRSLRLRPACLAIKSVVVLPEYQGSGVAALLFQEMAERAVRKGYRWVDLSITSEDNPDTPALARRMGAAIYKRYRVYRRPIPPA